MEVIFEVNENVLVARLFGELDHHAAAGIREDIDRSLERCAPCDLVFDFEKVTYMDSAGIGIFSKHTVTPYSLPTSASRPINS